MFKKFTRDQVGQQSQVKSSQARGIKTALVTQFPQLETHYDNIFPKKYPVIMAKSSTFRCQFIIVNKEILFVERDRKYFPTLRVLHRYPFLLPKVQVDTGAIKFVLGGANVMCPGLTSPGGNLDTDFVEGDIVAIMAEGKQHCLAIGLAKMSRDEIRGTNKGHGLETLHHLGDSLWEVSSLD
eukprot:TRINITY_DN1401_c0_g1_i17.p1 TRINITY_DN1401_c0_g1~~TRINITY_DN1401_c0_g1_i17.p1  ORF type:complete len:182 (+),score=29.23 TRINITY_DN1401_c0_g1_i17:65-610(+)